VSYFFYFEVTKVASSGAWGRGYLAVPTVILWGETLGRLTRLLFWPSGYLIPLHHQRPVLATSLSDFWGKRWNTWVSDWFRQVFLRSYRKRPAKALLLIFICSGLWHELLINVPTILFIGPNLFGEMMVYFLLQAIGIALERRFRWLKGRPFTWLVVAVPSPLVVNRGLLSVLGLWH